jgi:hypothetical protein
MAKEPKDDALVFNTNITHKGKTYLKGTEVPVELAKEKVIEQYTTTYEKIKPELVAPNLADENKKLKAEIAELKAKLKAKDK